LFRELREKCEPHTSGRLPALPKECGIAAVQTHCGFLPKIPTIPSQETVAVLRDLAGFCKASGQNFRYETGQETPDSLLVRTMQDVSLGQSAASTLTLPI